jgi:hypothetical protein
MKRTHETNRMVRIQWFASNGSHPMVRIRWFDSNGSNPMVRIRHALDGRYRRRDENKYTRFQTKMTFVCSLARRFFCLIVLAAIIALLHNARACAAMRLRGACSVII